MKDCWHGCDNPHQSTRCKGWPKKPKQRTVKSVTQNISTQLWCKFGFSTTSKKDAVCDQGLWQEMHFELSLFSLKVKTLGVIVLNHFNIQFLKTTGK